MPDDTKVSTAAKLPAEVAAPVPMLAMPPAMALWFDDRLFERAKLIAKYIAEAEGFTPPHLVGKPQACFAVVERALTWKLSPYAVAQSTYQTPGGRVGYEGKLCQAILENSGQLEGGVTFEHVGDWSRVQGKFRIAESQKGTKYPAPTYTEKDEEGLGVIVRAQIRGEAMPRELKMDLRQAFPRNSTLWATDPKTQLCYTAVRRFASIAAPGLFMGVPFDRDDDAGTMIDVTPRPQREDFAKPPADAPAAERKAEAVPEPYAVADQVGEVHEFARAAEAASAFQGMLEAADSADVLQTVFENNGLLLGRLREEGKEATAEMLVTVYSGHLDALDQKARAAAQAKADEEKEKKKAAKPKAQQKAEPAPAAAPPAAEQGLAKWQPPEKRPTSPLKGGNWIAWLPWFVDQIQTMPREQLADFLSMENYGSEYNFMAEKRAQDREVIDAILDGRRG